MVWVALSLGSNVDAKTNLQACLNRLEDEFGTLKLSQVFESEPVGFRGDNFLNVVVTLETSLSLDKLCKFLKRIEDEHGRDRQQSRLKGGPLDIDLLVYGELAGLHEGIRLPRPEITENAYVLRPLSQLAGDRVHQPSGRTYGDLWAAYDKTGQNLWPVDFVWRDRVVSPVNVIDETPDRGNSPS
jgi:2-amino-4-hydroxy-6-hydroxymethyldihydropteridine diphosphokinase